MPGADDQFVVATAHDHLAVEDVPGVVEVVVDVQRGRRADRQGHLEHDGVHSGCAAVLDDQGVEEPPCLRLLVPGESTTAVVTSATSWSEPVPFR